MAQLLLRSAHMVLMGGQWPLVGRSDELRRMQSAVGRRMRGLVVAGPAGVGKTRLAHEYVEHTKDAGASVVRVAATRAASPLPLGAFDPLLPAFHHGKSAGVDDRADLIRRCAVYLMETAGERPLVLFIDDAHLLDDASATLVHQLAVTDAAFVVATIRTGETAPDPIAALCRDDAVERIELSGLSAEVLANLLTVILGGPVDPAVTHRLATLSQGNVLFLREIILGALDDGTLCNDGGIWRFVGPFSPSPRIAELVEIRLQGLSSEERSFLEVLSIGEPLSATELAAFGSDDLAEALERRGLISSKNDGRRLEIRLAHPLYGDVLRERTPVVRARRIAQSLADVVEATGARRREDTLKIATWRLEGGAVRPELMLEAALIARWRYDFPLALRLAQAAVLAGGGLDAVLLTAQLESLQGQGVEAENILSALTHGLPLDDRQRGLVAISRLDNYVFHLGNLNAGVQIAEEAEAAIEDDVWRDEIAAKRSSVVAGLHGPRAGAEVSLPLLERAKGRALVWAGINSAFCLARMGRLAEARDASDRARQAHLALSEPTGWYLWIHSYHRTDILAQGGWIDDAYEMATEEYNQGLADRSPEAQAWFGWQITTMVGERGFPRTAALFGRTAVGLFRELGRPRFEHFALRALALALALAGQAEQASDALRQMDGLGLAEDRYWATEVLDARAWTMVAAGELIAARKIFRNAATIGTEIGDLVGAVKALHSLARIGYAQDAVSELPGLGRQIEGPLAPARGAHVRALAEGDVAALESVSATFEDIGAILLAAEAAADAAVVLRRRGDPRHAAKNELRANQLSKRCENPMTPALMAIKTATELTRAEREVALLAVSGRQNKEIATLLGKSARTVANHLQHAYEKLGISSRSELEEALNKVRER